MLTKLRPALDLAAYFALRVTISALQTLPLSVCHQIAKGLAWLAGDLCRFRRQVVDDNLRHAFADASAAERQTIARAMWRHLFLMVSEIAHTPRKVHRTNWRERCDLPQVDIIVRLLVTDRPSVIISGHYGNFELGGYLLGMFGFATHTVARPLDNPHVDRFVNEFRGRTGQHILPKEGSRDAIEKLLGGGGILALLGDQAAGTKACWVNFFGRPASTHKAVSLFTLGYDAPTLVMATRRAGGPLEYVVDVAGTTDPCEQGFDLGDPTSLTQWFTNGLESLIHHAPEQYWWVHRRWKGTPPARVLKRLAEQVA